jgi:hypothetical protein
MIVLMISKTTTLLIIGLMAVLSIATIATVVNTASALPGRAPVNPGTTTATCASERAGEDSATCPNPGRGRP